MNFMRKKLSVRVLLLLVHQVLGKRAEKAQRRNHCYHWSAASSVLEFLEMFQDPLFSIPESAVLSGLQPGAYSWHLHMLIVDASFNEKHACVLLPDDCDGP